MELQPTQEEATRMPNATILVATGNPEQRVTLGKFLRHAGHEVVDCDIAGELANWLDAHESSYDIDLAFIDCKVLLVDDDLLPKLEKALGNEVPVVILTSHPCRKICFRTSALGLAGWLAQPVTQAEVEKMVSEILRRREKLRAEKESVVPTQPLTPRERVILRLLVRGLDNDEIARCLGISPETVHYHLKHVFEKLRVKSRTEAAALARELQMAPVPSAGRR
jgi:DNA-binding NarL/FixJ family response regulator